jgi:hypothetical protein
MKECPSEDRIDRYLMGRLSESEAVELEEHYFNCPVCFQKISERNELVEVIRERGAVIFEDTAGRPPASKVSVGGKIAAFLAPRRLAVAAAAVVLVAIALIVIPMFKGRGPELVSAGDESVRGASLTAIAPQGEMKAPPLSLEWMPVGSAAEYRLALSGPQTSWTAVTAATNVDLPESVKKAMKSGLYQWQVKAYSAQGTMLAASPRIEFRIAD